MNYMFVDIDGVLNNWHIGRFYQPVDGDPQDWKNTQISREGMQVDVWVSNNIVTKLTELIERLDVTPVWSTTWIRFPAHLDEFCKLVPGSESWDRIREIDQSYSLGSGKLKGIKRYLAAVDGEIDKVVVIDDMWTQYESDDMNRSNLLEVIPEWFLTEAEINRIEEFLLDW